MRNDFDARPLVVHTGLHGPLYYALMVPVYRALHPFGDVPALYAMRAATALLGVLLLLLVYSTCALVFDDRRIVRGATAATAFFPLNIYLASHVSNEMLAAVWVAAVFY